MVDLEGRNGSGRGGEVASATVQWYTVVMSPVDFDGRVETCVETYAVMGIASVYPCCTFGNGHCWG